MRAGIAEDHVPGSRPHTDADPGELLRWYEGYRRRQARRLLDLLPREAIRPLYRRAAASAASPASDPLGRLVDYCATLLPLPPFEVWVDDLARHPDAHLLDWHDTVEAPTTEQPATLATRELRRGAERWAVRLRAYAHRGEWRGHLAFRGPVATDAHDTAAVFHEASPGDLRDRFLGFEDAVLEGFLRSCLP